MARTKKKKREELAIQKPRLLEAKSFSEKYIRSRNINDRGMKPGKAAKQAYYASRHPEMRDPQHANKLEAYDRQAKAYRQAQRQEKKKKNRK